MSPARIAKTIRLGLRDLKHQRGFAILFVANLGLGLAGAMTLAGLEGSIDRTLTARSRSFLGADVRVSAGRPITAGEDAAFAEHAGSRPDARTGIARMVQLYSMAAAGERTRLAEVRGIAGPFPPRGRLELGRSGRVDHEQREALSRSAIAWADAGLLDQLGVSVGDDVRIGGKTFRIADTISKDAGISVRAASLAPRLYVAFDALTETGLIQLGSRVEYQILYGLAPGVDATEVAAAMRADVTDPRVSVVSHEEATDQISGAYQRVTRYLALVSLVALALAGVGCAYLFRAFLSRRLVDIAVLMSVGATRTRAQAWLFVQLFVLASVAAAFASFLAIPALPLFATVLADILPDDVALEITASEIVPTLLVAVSIGPACCIPLLAQLGRLRISELFQEHAALRLSARRSDAVYYVPALALLTALSFALTGSARVTAGFVAALLTVFALTGASGRAILGRASSAKAVQSVRLRLALRALSPKRRATVAAFTALATCAVLLSLPSQLRAVLDARLQPPPEADIPSLFVFDVQPEQADPLRRHIEASGTRLQRLAPMIRARLDAINGDDVSKGAGASFDPDAEGMRDRTRMLSRRYNLTYQAELAHTETLVEGRDFEGEYDFESGEPAEMSMEVDFAERLEVGVGDVLRFDVQGVPVEGVIVNLRAVDWNSMQPNFFVSFQPGVLEAAPAVFLGSIPALPFEAKQKLQASITDAFPNVSIIDVTRGVERLLGLIDQLQFALSATAVVSLLVGLVLIFAIAREEAERRRWDMNMLKVLGAGHGLIARSVDTEFALLAAAAALTGCLIGAGVSGALAYGLLDVPWSPAWATLGGVLVAMPAVVVLAARLAMRGVLSERPAAMLR